MRQGFGHTRHAFRVHSHLGAMTRRTKDANERNVSSIGDPQGQTLWLEGTMDSAQDKKGLPRVSHAKEIRNMLHGLCDDNDSGASCLEKDGRTTGTLPAARINYENLCCPSVFKQN
ncbi:hypothetical protein RRG08_033585 [Elysia crispata]|uniref:Uncharacterized protein n=1 Tax=Elysia crispata TaxID=231223 RepID=A0AAE0XPH6_9GAST|nr:hypothetical protein RRG08_033585 [Elysia crispata]